MLADLDAPPKVAPKPPPAPPPDVLDLTEAMAAPAPLRTPARRRASAPSMAPPTSCSPTERPTRRPSRRCASSRSRAGQCRRRATAAAPDRALISTSTMAAVDSAFNSLAHTVIGQNARTLEDLVKEMLRPMLKSWLDDNLPGLVERIVRAEIERVSRGRP